MTDASKMTKGAVPLQDGALLTSDVRDALRALGHDVHELRFDDVPWPGHVSFVGVGADGVTVRGVVVAEWSFEDGRAVLGAHARVVEIDNDAHDSPATTSDP